MRFWIKSRLDTRTLERLRAIRGRAIVRRHHPKQLGPADFAAALAEFDAYCLARGVTL